MTFPPIRLSVPRTPQTRFFLTFPKAFHSHFAAVVDFRVTRCRSRLLGTCRGHRASAALSSRRVCRFPESWSGVRSKFEAACYQRRRLDERTKGKLISVFLDVRTCTHTYTHAYLYNYIHPSMQPSVVWILQASHPEAGHSAKKARKENLTASKVAEQPSLTEMMSPPVSLTRFRL